MARFTSPDGVGSPGPTGPAGAPGEDGVGVPAGGAAGDILAKIDGTDFNTEWIENYTSTLKHIVKNANGGTISLGTPVYTKITNNSSNNIPVAVASNAAETSSSKTLGLMAETVDANEFGFVITEGLLDGVNTSTANTGDPIWLGVNGALIFGLANKPVAPAHLVFIGVVTRGQHNNGQVFVKIQNGFELDELHDVSTAGKQDGDVLSWNATSGLYEFVSAQSKIGAPLTLTQSSNHSSYPLTISSANEHGGGTGYSDIAKFTNSKSGASNINKHIRLTNDGSLEIVNNAYTATIFHLADNGALNGVATYNGATLGDTGWVQITSFGSGWSAVGQSVYSRVINNVLYMRGNVYNVSGSGTGAFTLPVGHRPTTEMVFVVQKYGAGELSHITIGTDGVVVPNSTGAWLTGVTFPVN